MAFDESLNLISSLWVSIVSVSLTTHLVVHFFKKAFVPIGKWEEIRALPFMFLS